ncbi:MAG: type II toxin-antitoxin system RelE/ParE family toxin [Terracidiphilus sp.]
MIELRVSEAAALSIVEQSDYHRQASDIPLAQRWEDAVDEAVNTLLRSPGRGAPCRFRTPDLAGLRWILIPGFSKHIVFYRYMQQEQIVLIVQVLHGARNLEVILDEDA